MFCFCLLSILVETFRDNGDFTHLFIPMSLVFTFFFFFFFKFKFMACGYLILDCLRS